MTCIRSRTWSISCSSTTSQSSMTSIYPGINQGPSLAEPADGHTNAYGSFTTTIPAAHFLRPYLSLDIPVLSNRRADEQRGPNYGCDTPSSSPLSFFQPFLGSRRSPSISRTLLTDSDCDDSFTDPVASLTSLPSPSVDNNANISRLHPVLAAVERGSKLSSRTTCSTCMKAGTNFPRCPRCDKVWCCRACRLQGGKRHICAIHKM